MLICILTKNVITSGSGTIILFVFFFFQAEDGIRDLTVTGVQTCALPIFVEGGHRQLPTDQKGLSRGLLDVFCSCPIVRIVLLGKRRHSQCSGGRNCSNASQAPCCTAYSDVIHTKGKRDFGTLGIDHVCSVSFFCFSTRRT